MLQNTPSWREIHNQKTADAAYMAGMNPDNGPKQIVKDLTNKLLSGSHIFEYGVGPGANALYLVEQGYIIEVQDVSDKMLEIFQENAKKKSLEIPMINSPAQDHIPSGLYDAFVCTYLLHFMSDGDARKVITNMQKYTNIG